MLQLALDALRHWAALGVDGFRFDLAPSLGRDRDGEFRPDAAAAPGDRAGPVLGRLKVIAEPWDLGPDGYRQGQFPPPFAMWNDRYRDCVRRFWRGDEAVLPELAGRLLGSADLYEAAGRRPQVSVNLVTSHDGFTLADLVSYADAAQRGQWRAEPRRPPRQSERQPRRRGADRRSFDPRAARRASGATCWRHCCLAQGTPMILMGDEIGRTQQGNNNAYCQDNELSWLAWPEAADRGLRR